MKKFVDILKKLRFVAFVVVLLCFFLPFVNISCNDQTIMSLTGFQLVKGADVDTGFSQGKQEDNKVDPEPYAIIAFVCAIVGIGISFWRGKWSVFVADGIAIAGVVFMLLLKTKLDDEVGSSGSGLLHIEYEYGFWLVFFFFIIAMIVNSFLIYDAMTDMKSKDAGVIKDE